MLDKNVLLILNRAFVDERFRQQLLADLEGTVRSMGIELSDGGLAELMAALDEGHDFATGLDQRVSQSGFALNPASLIRQKGSAKEHAGDAVSQHQTAAKTKRHSAAQKHATDRQEAVGKEITASEPIEYDEMDIEVEID